MARTLESKADLTPAAFVSVILPTHSDPGTLTYAIESVLRQSHVDFELLVVGDGATEETLEVAKDWASRDSRVEVVEFPKGPEAGWNNRVSTLRTSKGKFLFYIDEDDLWLPNHIESLVSALRESGSDFASSSPLTVTPDGGFELALVDYSRGPLRFSTSKAIYLFDTHSSHSRKSYDALVNEGLEPLAGGPAGLINSYRATAWVKWIHLPQITAISLHGAARRNGGVANSERADQTRALAESIVSGQLDSVAAMRKTSVVSHLWGIFHDHPPRNDCSDVRTYLTMLSASGSEAELLTWNALNLDQKNLAEATLRLFMSLQRGLFPRKKDAWITEFEFSEIVASLQRIVTGPPPLDRETALKWFSFFER